MGDNVWFRKAIPDTAVKSRGRHGKYDDNVELGDYEDRARELYKTGVKNPLRGADKVNLWLASSEDLAAIHKTRSELGGVSQ